jgi:hypothetical protein
MQAIRSLMGGSFVAAAFAISLQAQCFDPSTGVSVGVGDDIVLPSQVIGFSFPFNGTTYTTVHPCTNGFVYLGNGAASTAALCCTGDPTTLAGAASPMIAPYWTDLNILAVNSGAVKFNAVPGKAIITWENAAEYYNSGLFSFQLQLYPSGEMDFVYGSTVGVYGGHVFLTGMSPGSGALFGAATNFSVVGVGPTNTNYQLFGPALGSIPLSGKGVHFVPTVPGYVWSPTNCSASHTSYGSGCYTRAASIYDWRTSAAAASAMNGSAMTMFATPSGYACVSVGSYVAPTGAATVLPLTDDSETTVILGSAFPYPGGSTTSLVVCSNGFVSVATGNGVSYTPDIAATLAAPQTAWWMQKDFNPSVAGSGQIKFEEVGSISYVTWDGVANYGGTSTDVTTMQFQFDRSNGNVVLVHQMMSVAPPTTTTNHISGFSPGGPSIDPGSVDFLTQLPVTTSAVDFLALALSAAPNPISTPTTGTLVTYTTDNIPEFVPTSGIHIAINILSLNQVPAPGIDLIIIGAPGCPALVATLDLVQSMVGPTSTLSVTFPVPPGVPPGTYIYSQSAALVQPGSLPGGMNAFGLETSNGISSFITLQ